MAGYGTAEEREQVVKARPSQEDDTRFVMSMVLLR